MSDDTISREERGIDKIHHFLIRNGYVLDEEQSGDDFDVWIDCICHGGDIKYRKDKVYWSLYDFEEPRYSLTTKTMKGPYLVRKSHKDMTITLSAPTLAAAVSMSREPTQELE